MVERSIDKKIRTIREILQAPPAERSDSEGKSHPYKYLTTDTPKIPYKLLMVILNELKLTVSSEHNIPLYDDFGEISGEYTDDYLLEVIVEKEDADRLSTLLKEYESKFPKRQKTLIREKTLELIAQKIANLDTGNNLIRFLKNCGVDKELIVPNSKWRMIFGVLVYLANSSKKEDEETLSKIIGEATHPIMHKGDVSSAEALRKEFNSYLSYDNMGIAYKEDDGTYWALQEADEDEAGIQALIEADEYMQGLERRSEKQLKFLCQPENKEKISLLRKAYQLLMNVVFAFCENPTHPTLELNNHFQLLYKLINITINELELSRPETYPFSRNEHFFYLPFTNLFNAEKYYSDKGGRVNWQKIRPEMNAMYGDIEGLYREVNGSDILAEPDKQKKLNDIQLYLSELKEKAKETKEKERKEMEQKKESDALPIKIVGETAIKISGFQAPSSIKSIKNNPSELYLNAVGDLWREPKDKYCYPMGEKSDRHKLLRYLATNKGHKQTADISLALEGKNEQSIRTEIGKIRGNIKKYLNIDGKQVIEEGRKGSGYRIGSKYKITIKGGVVA